MFERKWYKTYPQVWWEPLARNAEFPETIWNARYRMMFDWRSNSTAENSRSVGYWNSKWIWILFVYLSIHLHLDNWADVIVRSLPGLQRGKREIATLMRVTNTRNILCPWKLPSQKYPIAKPTKYFINKNCQPLMWVSYLYLSYFRTWKWYIIIFFGNLYVSSNHVGMNMNNNNSFSYPNSRTALLQKLIITNNIKCIWFELSWQSSMANDKFIVDNIIFV